MRTSVTCSVKLGAIFVDALKDLSSKPFSLFLSAPTGFFKMAKQKGVTGNSSETRSFGSKRDQLTQKLLEYTVTRRAHGAQEGGRQKAQGTP